MKPFISTLFVSTLICCLNCKPEHNLNPTPIEATPAVNQVNSTFKTLELECLVKQWHDEKYKNEPVVFRIVNGTDAYNTFFACHSLTVLPAIDFTTNSLLIGMKGDFSDSKNTPVSISQVTQTLVPGQDGNYILDVSVTGKRLQSGYGSQWFAFASVVPKITSAVKLSMQYQYQ